MKRIIMQNKFARIFSLDSIHLPYSTEYWTWSHNIPKLSNHFILRFLIFNQSKLINLPFLWLQTHILLMDAFLQNNRLDHVSRVMASHPSYLEHFLRTQHFILRGDGPLPYDYRHLIAIMVSTTLVFLFFSPNSP